MAGSLPIVLANPAGLYAAAAPFGLAPPRGREDYEAIVELTARLIGGTTATLEAMQACHEHTRQTFLCMGHGAEMRGYSGMLPMARHAMPYLWMGQFNALDPDLDLLALLQDNLKRIFAYSGIAQGGYMMFGILVACSVPEAKHESPGQIVNTGLDSLLFYLVAYGLMTVGALAILSHLAFGDKPVETVDDLAGLGRTHPIAAAALAVCFFSLIGLPLTAGFYGKFKLFFDAFSAPTSTPMKNLYRVIVLIGAINAAVAAVYYLRVIGVLYLRSPLKPEEPAKGYPALVAGVVCTLATLALGIFPQPLMDAAHKAVAQPPAQVKPLAEAK